MKTSLTKLSSIAAKPTRSILGLMSGTSLDGLDIALCKISGSGVSTRLTVERYTTYPYAEEFRNKILQIQSKEQIPTRFLSAMNAKLGHFFAEMINLALIEWEMEAEEIDLIASHGQTIYHADAFYHDGHLYPNSTLQIGDGDQIAVRTGIITVSDFRQKHVAAGGQGAPLVAYGDAFLFTHPEEYRILLNIGGIANFTLLPPSNARTSLLSTDVGPGNTLLNSYMSRLSQLNLPYDPEGRYAARGTINEALLKELIAHPFFELPYPKTTGVETFSLSYFEQALKASRSGDLPVEDNAATLTEFTVYGIKKALEDLLPKQGTPTLYVSGGGIHNLFMQKRLQENFPNLSIQSTLAIGLPPDAKEAALFALLANECVAGIPMETPNLAGLIPVSMGKISFPD